MDIFSSSVTLLEGYNYALRLVNNKLLSLITAQGTDGCMVLRPWTAYSKLFKSGSDIAELQDLRNVCVVTRDNAGENKSREVLELF